ncbi:MAG TPA: efflux RND transporter periplasmic adaptor subunit [Hansschlegelia sp.]
MSDFSTASRRTVCAGAAALAIAGAVFATLPASDVAADAAVAATPAATPASVAAVQSHDITNWTEFSGRLEAIDRVEVRSRVAGEVETVHFREGALVEKGAALFTIDPEPYKAEVDRARSQVSAAEARLTLAKSDLDRGRRMTALSTISQRDLDSRTSGLQEAEASLQGAKAALRTAELNLGYTEVRAPVAGRVGKIEVTAGNLVAAGPGAPVLTRLVSVNPIYASFDADEETLMRALDTLPKGGDRSDALGAIPVEMSTLTSDGATRGKLIYVDPTVDAGAGSVRVRAVFDNPDGRLMPGQFARLRMGQAKTAPALLVSERAIGVDQDKKYVLVVGQDQKATYREVKLGPSAEGLKVVLSGLEAGERIVVNGLQKLRPGALVAPEPVAMDGSPLTQKQASAER